MVLMRMMITSDMIVQIWKIHWITASLAPDTCFTKNADGCLVCVYDVAAQCTIYVQLSIVQCTAVQVHNINVYDQSARLMKYLCVIAT